MTLTEERKNGKKWYAPLGGMCVRILKYGGQGQCACINHTV